MFCTSTKIPIEKSGTPTTHRPAKVVGSEDLSIDMFLEDPNKTYSSIMHLIDYIAYGPKFLHTNQNPPEIGPNQKKSRFTNKKPVCLIELSPCET